MKNFINTILALGCVIAVIVSIPVFATTTREYMEVVTVTRETGNVILIDRNGDLWEFKGYGYSNGNRVIVDMYDNGTPDKYDDRIIEVKHIQ